jgi:glutamate-1-semialdehyde 2,1-aminomutase
VPSSIAGTTVLVHYNDLDAAREVFEKYPNQIACFAVEPVAGNMGVVPPAAGYLQGLRELCTRHGALLLLDEVMTGFRVAWGGAQNLYNVTPDLTMLGKVIGGGLPMAAYGGKRELMNLISPNGPVYQAGTLSGNPLAMAGGLATLEILQEPGAYETLEQRSAKLAAGLQNAAEKAKVPVAINRVGSMIGLFFSDKPVRNFADATAGDTAAFAKFFHAMLEQGVYLAPSMFEALFVGLAHDDEAIEQTLKAAEKSFASLK